jgi:tetratricopeptide (TPR) repeat protein
MPSELEEFLASVRAVDELEGSIAALELLDAQVYEDDALYHSARGTLLARSGAFSASVVAFESCCELEPETASYRASLGMALLDQALGYNLDQPLDEPGIRAAQDQLEQAVQLDGQLGYALAGLGFAHHLLGDLESGLRCLDRAIQIEPTLVMAWYHRGELLKSRGSEAEAARSLREALRLDPNCEPARASLDDLAT